MSSREARIESGIMPDSNPYGWDEIDRVDWEQIIELAKAREYAPRAALAEDA
jgi:hypothetical protein